jgi:hypothetical protein
MTGRPAAELETPTPTAPIPDLVNNIIGGKQYISPSYWLGWAADKVCGVNPWSWVAEQFAGDWNAAAVASSALKNLGEFNQVYAESITNVTKETIPDDWTGNAATAAQRYFQGISQALTDQVSALNGVAGQFHSLAAGMEEMAQGLQSLLQDLTDWLIVIGISAAATAAASWTVVGGLIGAGSTAASIAAAVRTWYLVLDAHDAAWAAVQTFVGLTAGYLGGLHAMEKHPLPRGAYNHPAV